MCIRDSDPALQAFLGQVLGDAEARGRAADVGEVDLRHVRPVSYTHLRAHETVLDLVCRLLLEKNKARHINAAFTHQTTHIPTKAHRMSQTFSTYTTPLQHPQLYH